MTDAAQVPGPPNAHDLDRVSASARIDWFAKKGSQSERDRAIPQVPLPPPADVHADRGRGHVTISWSPVPGAVGYLVHRAATSGGPFEPIDQHGGDVLAVPHSPFLDTSSDELDAPWYAVASLPDIEAEGLALSVPVEAVASVADGRVSLHVDVTDVRGALLRPWRQMIGSEYLALLLQGAGPGGHQVGAELSEAFRIVHRELGTKTVRAHAILHDTLGVYRSDGDDTTHDFTNVDRIVDRVIATGLRPVIELSFMPADLASDPTTTVFAYEGIISPPRDEERWASLVRDLARHLGDRYGREEVLHWAFEVWNEPNLQLFWAAAESDYFRLYEVTARALKSVDERFLVGGPATAAAAWVGDLLAYCAARDVPIDFISTHTYGVAPLDLRPITAAYNRPDLPLLWTEWGVSAIHAAPINDSVWAAPLVARGMRSAAGRVDALAYWVASDHFVELGEAPSLFHGGFGLLTIGNLRKPRYWAIAILERLGEVELRCAIDGDGAGSLVEAWASRDPDGRVAIAAWNGTVDQTKMAGDPVLDRVVTLTVDGLGSGTYEVRHYRVDADHSNIVRTWEGLGRPDWPDDAGWARLRDADRLVELAPGRRVRHERGQLELAFDLPMPAISLVELVPASHEHDRAARP
jgi:xylan 1,4-beta-xylosidase